MKVTTDACLFGGWVADEVKREKLRVKNVLDVGTGTGLLSLMFAQKNSLATIDAIEIDEDAYQQAKQNVAGSSFVDNVNVIHGDIKTFSFSKKYDLIFSNPPFYEREIASEDQKKNTAHHHSGLVLEELLPILKANLADEGEFGLLLPFKRHKEVKKILVTQNLFVSKIVFVRQSTTHDYFRVMIMGKLRAEGGSETTIDEISIWNGQQQYTKEFRQLLKDYYLGLTSQPPLQ